MTPDLNGKTWGTTRVRLRRSTRCLSNLEKHYSLPELRIPREERLQFHCPQCGFANTLFPLCFWCTWSSQQAEHAFEVFIPRVRHVSSPSRAFQLEQPSKDISAHDYDSTPSSFTTSAAAAHGRTPQISQPSTRRKSRGLFVDTPSFVAHSTPEAMAAAATMGDLNVRSHDDSQMGTKEHITAMSHRVDEDNVATATLSAYSASVCEGQQVARDPLLDSSPHLPSEEKAKPSVDRPMMSPMPSQTQNSPVPLLLIDLHDMKTDEDQLSNLVTFNDDGTKPSNLSPRQRELRSLRRRKHLNVLQTSPSDLAAREPIPISLKLRSPASKASLKLQHVSPMQDAPRTLHESSRPLSQQLSIQTDSSDSPVSPEMPMSLPMPPSTSPTGLSTSGESASPVRLGHPSRPYYSAIRKQGVSPTSPTSSQHSPVLSSSPTATAAPRRQSYTPSTSTTLPVMSATASRHLSTSTMFCSPACSLPSENGFSALSLLDDENVDISEGAIDETRVMPPTPTPNTTRFSFPRRAKDAHRKSLVDSIHGSSASASQSQSLSFSRRSGYRGSGVGFSMSGQTELRMALAAGAASAGIVEDGFRFRETAPAAPEALEGDGSRVNGHGRRSLEDGDVRRAKGASRDAGLSNSFMERVRKLRKGLKDILLMISTTTT